LADGKINQAEAEFLLHWLALSNEAADEWPGDILFARIGAMLKDGHLDTTEESELLKLLINITGGDAARLNAHSLSSGLPIDAPAPTIVIPGNRFCFTGKFLFGTRNRCCEEIEARMGIVIENIAQNLNYLVIGLVGSRDWAHSSFGRKIEQAIAYKRQGIPLAIVAEEHFVKALLP